MRFKHFYKRNVNSTDNDGPFILEDSRLPFQDKDYTEAGALNTLSFGMDATTAVLLINRWNAKDVNHKYWINTAEAE